MSNGLCCRMDDHFYTQISIMDSVVTTIWCWNYVPLRSALWISMLKGLMVDRVNIFSCIDRSIILSMSVPKNYAFSSAMSSNLFMCGQILSSVSRKGIVWLIHWCAYFSNFSSFVVPSTIWSCIVLFIASGSPCWFSSVLIFSRVSRSCWNTWP